MGESKMSIKSIKLWQVILAFIIWLGTMFLPATVNQEKLGTSFDYRESRENFFYFISHQFPFYSIILAVLLLLSIILLYRKARVGKYLAFASLIYYIGFLVVGFPGSIIFNRSLSGNTFEGEAALFLTFYGVGYIVSVIVGCLALLLLYLYSLSRINE